MNNVQEAKKYFNMKWSTEEKECLGSVFSAIDLLLLKAQNESDSKKIEALSEVHEKAHSIVLAIGLEEMMSEIINDNIY